MHNHPAIALCDDTTASVLAVYHFPFLCCLFYDFATVCHLIVVARLIFVSVSGVRAPVGVRAVQWCGSEESLHNYQTLHEFYRYASHYHNLWSEVHHHHHHHQDHHYRHLSNSGQFSRTDLYT